MDVPLLNSYKKKYLKIRLPQTALGGLKLKLGYQAPCYVYLLQIILFLIPPLLGAAFVSLVKYSVLDFNIAVYVYGSVTALYTLLVNIISYAVRRKKSAIKPISTNRNLCGEEKPVEFTSCCGAETVEFIIPGRKHLFNVFFHSLISGPHCALGLWYLLPSTLDSLYGNSIVATVLMSVFGWIAVAIAQYSLTAGGPPECATFRATDPLELNMLSRPFHCVCFYGIFVVARFFAILLLTDQILHGVFCALPLLWLMGWLPPIDAMILWGLEQAHVYLFGGSPKATDFWNVVYISWTTVFFVIALMVPYGGIGLIACSCFGYFLSTDLSLLTRTLAVFCCPRKFPPTRQEVVFARADLGFLWSYGLLEFCLIYFLMIMVGGLTTALNFFIVNTDKVWITDYLGYALIGMWATQALLAECQKVTVFGGIFRNFLYPESVEKSSKFLLSKRKLVVLGIIRRIIVNFVAPFTMVAYMSVEVDWSGKELPWEYNNNNTVRFWDIMAVNRGYRWIFQSTPAAMLEFSVAHILKVAVPSTESVWLPLGLATQLLIIGVIRDRLSHIINKLYFVFALLVTNWTDAKQRRHSTRLLIILNALFFPLILTLILLASAFAAPLLPLFTLPIFLLGYPRPIRSWPGAVGASANVCQDTVCYDQCCPYIAKAMRTAISNGSLGEPVPGRHYLVRWQDRTVWVQVLERGYFYVKLSIKGLELQDTSCHAAEVAFIDEVIEKTFENKTGKGCCQRRCCHPSPVSVLRPYDAAIVKTYSDARNQLTGVIDSPQVLKTIEVEFLKTLVWVAVGQVYWNHRNVEEGRTNLGDYDFYDDDEDDDDDDFSRPSSSLSNVLGSRASSARSNKSNKMGQSGEDFSRIPHHTRSRGLSAKSGDKRTPIRSQPVGSSGAQKQGHSADMDDLVDELNTYGRQYTQPKASNKHGLSNGNNYQPNRKAGAAVSSQQYHHSSRLAPPAHWQKMPIEDSVLRSLQTQFPVSWYRHIISFLKFQPKGGCNSQQIANEIAKDEELMNRFSLAVLGCYSAVNGKENTCSDVLKVYQGHLPVSDLTSWIEEKPELYSLTIQAYRLAVKLAIDQAAYGTVTSLEELHDYLDNYDSNWYIGVEGDKGWEQSILRNKQNCFALAQDPDKKTYTSRVLTLQDTPVYISSVNCESVRAQWANLNMELLYMTNDDDERYSIQAHPKLLRNLTVQAADPPLGYPIYSSQPVSVPTL